MAEGASDTKPNEGDGAIPGVPATPVLPLPGAAAHEVTLIVLPDSPTMILEAHLLMFASDAAVDDAVSIG